MALQLMLLVFWGGVSEISAERCPLSLLSSISLFPLSVRFAESSLKGEKWPLIGSGYKNLGQQNGGGRGEHGFRTDP